MFIFSTIFIFLSFSCSFAFKTPVPSNSITKSNVRLIFPKIQQPSPRKPQIQLFDNEPSKDSAFEKVASMGLAGVLAIAVAEAIFWAAGMPLAAIWYKATTGLTVYIYWYTVY
jgi:hypothetical protein